MEERWKDMAFLSAIGLGIGVCGSLALGSVLTFLGAPVVALTQPLYGGTLGAFLGGFHGLLKPSKTMEEFQPPRKEPVVRAREYDTSQAASRSAERTGETSPSPHVERVESLRSSPAGGQWRE